MPHRHQRLLVAASIAMALFVARLTTSNAMASDAMRGSVIALSTVSDTGSYQVSIPIQVPDYHDVTPSIRLAYDSSGGNGPLGWGWALQVGSRITRSAQPTGTPHYDATDQLWLDGVELVECPSPTPGTPPPAAGTSCATGGTHVTLVETFRRISYASDTNLWTVWGRDGTRYTYSPRYGDVTSLTKTRFWVLTAVEDTHGNRASYDYICGAGGVCYVGTITYGGGLSCMAEPDRPVGTPVEGVRIQFYWESRPDPVTTAIGGDVDEMSWRLRAIDVLETNSRVRVYQINYRPELSATLGYQNVRSWIDSVQLFGSDAQLDAAGSGTVISGTASPPYRFDAPTYSSIPSQSSVNTFPGSNDFLPLIPTQIALPQTYNHRRVQFLPVTSVVVPTHKRNAPRAVEATTYASTALADFDGDGRTDFTLWSVDPTCENLTTRTLMASWSPTRSPVDSTQAIPQANLCDTMSFSGDIDGDGRSDLLFVRYRRINPFDPANLRYEAEAIPARSGGDGFFDFSTPTVLWTADTESDLLNSRCGAGDMNGDGRVDLVCTIKQPGGWRVSQAISIGGGRLQIRQSNQPTSLTDFHVLAVADANGDGLSDLIVIDERGPANAAKLDLKIATSLGETDFSWKTQPTDFDAVASNQTSRLLTGDFNGDARADFAYFVKNDDDSGGAFMTFTSTGAPAHVYTTFRQRLSGNVPQISLGDLDGDGLDDVMLAVHHPAHSAARCGTSVNYDHASLTVIFSNGTGIFPMLDTSNPICYDETDWAWYNDDYHSVQAINANGDGRADFFQYFPGLFDTGTNTLIDVLSLTDRPGSMVAAELSRWRSADLNNDGVADWVYVNYGNPGAIVLAQVSRPDGTRQLVRSDIAPSMGDLGSITSVSNWYLVDIGGGTRNTPDGKADIVIVDDAGQQIVTLMGDGTGHWTKGVTAFPFSPMTILRGHAVVAPESDVRAWRVMDVDGDGLADLVNLTVRMPMAGLAAVHVVTLHAGGDGTWSPTSGDYTFRGNWRSPNVRSFFPVDINGDGRVDLVQMEHDFDLPPGFDTSIYSLIARADGAWDDRYNAVNLGNEASGRWQPMEVNGDGRTDLVALSSAPRPPGQPLLLSVVLSQGDGTWRPRPGGTPITPTPLVDLDSIADLRIADLDGDGKDEIVHRSQMDPGQMETLVIWNRYPRFVGTATTNLPSGSAETHAWQLVDLDGDDRPELVRARVGGAIGVTLDVVSLSTPETRMTSARNGMGAAHEVTYSTRVGRSATMPSGMMTHVVASLGVRATDTTGPYAQFTQYSYSGATFSRKKRQFLGFEHIERADATRITVTDFELTDECHARSTNQELRDPLRQLLERSTSTYVSIPRPTVFTAPPLPTIARCLPESAEHQEWERSAAPRISRQRMQFDDYGNLTELIETGDVADPADDRRTTSGIKANTTDFIVDRVSFIETYDLDATGAWRKRAGTYFEYDQSNDYTIPPRQTGDLTRERHWNDRTNGYVDVKYAYEPNGNVHVVSGPPTPSNATGVATTMDYDCEQHRFVEKICNQAWCSTVNWDKRLALVRSVVDPNAAETIFGYDALSRPQSVTRPDHSFDRWQWPAQNQWNTPSQAVRHERSSGAASVLWDTAYFDGLGRESKVEQSGGISRETTAYDGASARAKAQSAPHYVQDPPAVTQYDYDAEGRNIVTRHPDNRTRRFRYDVGRVTRTDELGATTAYRTDAFGRIVAVEENLRSCIAETCPITESGTTRYEYDALDRLRQIIDAKKNETTIDWNSLGQQRRVCDPDRGCTALEWNDDGTQAAATDANGSKITMTYDPLGRLTVRNSFAASGTGTRTVTWTWDVDQRLKPLPPASIGRVTRVEDSSASAQLDSKYQYDALGRVVQSSQCVDKRCVEMATEFDLAGRVSSMLYPDSRGRLSSGSRRVRYTYDAAGRVASLNGYADRIHHDALGRIDSLVLANGVQEKRPFDPLRGWTNGTSIVSRQQGSLFQQVVRHDYAGRVRQEAIKTSGASRTDTFGHDDLGRLTSVTSTDPSRVRDFQYDILGDMTFESRLGTIANRDRNHVHAITDTMSGNHYEYDDVGQLLRSNQLTLRWNDDHRPSEITDTGTGATSAFAYDWSGRRVKAVAANRFTVSPNPFVDVDRQGGITGWIVVDGRRIARQNANTVSFLHADALGSTRLVTDRTGRVIDKDDYGTWGEDTRLASASGNPFHFGGGRDDDAAGLLALGARSYDPGIGHFISADTIVPSLFNPQSLNRYSYVSNDPVTAADPTGHGEQCAVQYREVQDGNGTTELTVCSPDDPADEWEPFPTNNGTPPDTTGWTAPPLVSAEPARENHAGEPKFPNDADIAYNPDAFVWASVERKVEANRVRLSDFSSKFRGMKLKPEVSGEVVFIRGVNKLGPYDAVLGATGASVEAQRGSKSGYAAILGGYESVTQSYWGTQLTTKETEPDILVEGGFGPLGLGGAYQTGTTNDLANTGVFFGVRFGNWGAGFGFNLQAIAPWYFLDSPISLSDLKDVSIGGEPGAGPTTLH